MRRIFQEPKWKAHSKRRQEYELSRRRRAAARKKRRPRTVARDRKPLERIKVLHAPTNFCLFQNPEGVLSFVQDIKTAAGRKRSPYIDLTEVETITPETLALLVSVVKDGRLGTSVNGNFPKAAVARKMVEDSGFLQHVSRAAAATEAPSGSIQVNRTNIKVVPNVAQEMVRFAMKRLGRADSPEPGAYRVIVECMSNTHQHAAARGLEARERWWLMVYAPPDARRASFTFVDNGIGIAQSLDKRRLLDRIKVALGIRNQGDLLYQLLAGEIGSRTGLDYRGKGLPAMRQQHERGAISRLRMISNQAFADLETGTYVHLTQGFSGTVVSFDLVKS